MIKNFFYAKVRKEIRRLNNEFKKIEPYKSTTLIEFIELQLTQTLYFWLLKELNASVLELAGFPLTDIGELILKSRKKTGPRRKKAIRKPQKKSSKRVPIIECLNQIKDPMNL